jgi:hypothetical protein
MAGGGNRRGGAAGEAKIGTGNVFAALETLKKKKKKPAAGKAGAKGGSKAAKGQEPPKPEVFWAPAPLITKSWADVEDDDDDDYFATTAPPTRPVWGDAAAKDRDAPALEEVRSFWYMFVHSCVSLFVFVPYGIVGLQSVVERFPPFLFSLCSYMFVFASSLFSMTATAREAV